MNKHISLIIGMIGMACYGLGVFSAYALHQTAYQEGWLHSSVSWSKIIGEIESDLQNDGKAVVGNYRLIVDKKRKVVRVIKK
jgi:hypothetical protein